MSDGPSARPARPEVPVSAFTLDLGALLPWLALGFALSPVIAELAAHLQEHAWARPALLFGPLYVAAMLRERRLAGAQPRPQARARASRAGLVCLIASFALIVVALVGGLPTLARPALPLSLFGLAQLRGRSLRGASLLALWLVPLPSFIAALPSPAVEQLWARAAGLAAAPIGTLLVEGSRLAAPGAAMRLAPADAGLPLAWLLAGLALFHQLWRGRALRLPAICAAALAAIPLQALAVVIAGLLLASGRGVAAEMWLHTLWLPAVALFGAAWGLRPDSTAPGFSDRQPAPG